MRSHKTAIVILLFGLVAGFSAGADQPAPSRKHPSEIINLRDPKAVQARKPLLIAHRGGVVAPKAPECSLTGMRLAARAGYDMVELDIRPTRDGVPIVFHDPNLKKACGIDKRVADMDAGEILKVKYLAAEETISTLDTALTECVKLKLGVMFDFKTPGDKALFQEVEKLIRKHHLENSALVLNINPVATEHLAAVAVVRVQPDEMDAYKTGRLKSLAGKHIFGEAKGFSEETAKQLRGSGVYLFPAINYHNYPPATHLEEARRNIARMRQLDVEGYQIDSRYQAEFGLAEVESKSH